MYPVQGAGMTTRASVFLFFKSKADKHDFLKHSTKVKNTLQKKTQKKPQAYHAEI